MSANTHCNHTRRERTDIHEGNTCAAKGPTEHAACECHGHKHTQQHSLCDAPHDVIKFIILVVHFDRDGAARQLDVCALRAVYSVCAYGIRWYHLCSEGGP